MTPDPLQSFRDRNARDEKNALIAWVAFTVAAVVIVLTACFHLWRVL